MVGRRSGLASDAPAYRTNLPRWALTAGAAVLLVVLVMAASGATSMKTTVGVFGLAIFIFLCAALGTERLGFLCLCGSFATSPMYKALAPAGTTTTPTDLLLVLGFALIFPKLLTRRAYLPPVYVAALLFITVNGIISSALSSARVESFATLVFWIMVMGVLPGAIALWAPSLRRIDMLCWSYIAGHVFSTFYGLATGRITGGRLYGLTTHPNFYGEGCVLTSALSLYLYHRLKPHNRWIALVTFAFGAVTVVLSGSRASTAVLALIVVLIPIVERSAKAIVLVGGMAVAGFTGILFLLEQGVGSGSSLGRFTGSGTANGSDEARTQGLSEGFNRFLHHPILGEGLHDLFNIHNNYLEVVSSIGIFGLVAYVIVFIKLGSPLFSLHPLRRLCYTAVVTAVIGAFIPSLYDRSMWVITSLAIIPSAAAYRHMTSNDDEPLDDTAPVHAPATLVTTP